MITLATLSAAVDRALSLGRFFVANSHRLQIEHVEREVLSWEVFRGHLLDPSHARETRTFECWNVLFGPDDLSELSPIISIQSDGSHGQIFVVRRLLTHGYEAYEDSPGVIMSRPVQKWVGELVGTIDVNQIAVDELERELSTYLFLAVIGSSRLPITSLESPLPAFSMGHLSYAPDLPESDQSWTDPVVYFAVTVASSPNITQQAKALETALRALSAEELPRLVSILPREIVGDRPDRHHIHLLFRTLFNHVALSPYTGFGNRFIAVMLDLAMPERCGPLAIVDLLSYMLRNLGRHLAAFDLTLFHSFGANYPDALFLDALLKAYLKLIATRADLFVAGPDDTASMTSEKRRRRRALRQACLVRKQYEGHPVPDAPTSMGENLRVLPPPFTRVPEEQISQMAKRRRRLFEGEPTESLFDTTAQQLIGASLLDLKFVTELQELGTAYFLDRPLGLFKQPGEVDRTPLVSYEAFSRAVCKRRLTELKSWGWITLQQHEDYSARLNELAAPGLPAMSLEAVERPGVVSLADAYKVAADFVLVRITPRSWHNLLSHYDLGVLEQNFPGSIETLKNATLAVLSRSGAVSHQAALRVYDRGDHLRFEFGFPRNTDLATAYRERDGVELLEGLQLLRIWNADDRETAAESVIPEQEIWIKLRKHEQARIID